MGVQKGESLMVDPKVTDCLKILRRLGHDVILGIEPMGHWKIRYDEQLAKLEVLLSEVKQ